MHQRGRMRQEVTREHPGPGSVPLGLSTLGRIGQVLGLSVDGIRAIARLL